MSNTEYISDCDRRRLLFVTGKGGVGKSSVAWATALAAQRRGKKVAVAAWKNGQGFPPPPGIDFIELETLACFREYVLSVVKFEKLFNVVFDNPVLRTFVVAAPGLSDTVIAGKIWDLWHKQTYDLLVVDMPASGHAIQFFQSPHGVNKVFSVGVIHRNLVRIFEMLKDPSVRLDLVTLPEELPVQETLELKAQLEKLHPLHFGFIHVNRLLPDFQVEQEVSPAIRPWCERYESERRGQASSLTPLNRLGMATVKHPRFATESATTALEQMTQRMAPQ